jgi:hypothetical protein
MLPTRRYLLEHRDVWSPETELTGIAVESIVAPTVPLKTPLPLIINAQQWTVAHIGETVPSCRRHAQYRLLDASFDSNLLRKWSGFVDRLDKMLMKPIRPEESGTLLRCTRS